MNECETGYYRGDEREREREREDLMTNAVLLDVCYGRRKEGQGRGNLTPCVNVAHEIAPEALKLRGCR